jgi:excisionase family DNA binding protein
MKAKPPILFPPESPVMTLTEVSAYLHIHPSTCYRLLREGKIPGWRIGIGKGDHRFNRETIDAWRASQTAKVDSR